MVALPFFALVINCRMSTPKPAVNAATPGGNKVAAKYKGGVVNKTFVQLWM